MKFNLAEVIYEDDNELTMTHIKDQDLPNGNSGKQTPNFTAVHQRISNSPKVSRTKKKNQYGSLNRRFNSNQIEFSSLESLIEENDCD